MFGEITKQVLHTEFIRLDDRKFEKYVLPIDEFATQEDIVETIESLPLERQNLYEIVLVGNRHFSIHTREILKLVQTKNILKIKDETQIGYDIEEIAKENNLRGIFVRQVIQQCRDSQYTEEQIKKAIELGLEVM